METLGRSPLTKVLFNLRVLWPEPQSLYFKGSFEGLLLKVTSRAPLRVLFRVWG